MQASFAVKIFEAPKNEYIACFIDKSQSHQCSDLGGAELITSIHRMLVRDRGVFAG